jgi:glyoxylase-like metal-dependent hydrolase (beta-lactamase superfamily II)
VLEVIEIPAHSPSSVAFLDRKERILFTGDEVASFVMLYWMQTEPQPTIEQHAKNMEKLLKYRDHFDFICSGHGSALEDASIVENYLKHDCEILAGHIEGELMVLRTDDSGNGPDPRDFRMYQIEFKRSSRYKNTGLGYDIRYVFNRQNTEDQKVQIR